MSSRKSQPRWWQLYVGLPLICALFIPEMRLHLTYIEHVILQLGILGLIYAFLQMWMRANRRAMMDMDADAIERQGGWDVRVYQFPVAELAKGARALPVSKPASHFSDGELKGVLSTTFEMDYPEQRHYVDDREVAVRKD